MTRFVRPMAVLALLVVSPTLLAAEPPHVPVASVGAVGVANSVPVVPEEFDDGYRDGSSAARRRPVAQWALLGAGGTCLLSAPGCLGAGFVADGSVRNTPLDAVLPHSSAGEYRSGYEAGYASTLRRRRVNAALVGGGVVVVTLLAVTAALVIHNVQQAEQSGAGI